MGNSHRTKMSRTTDTCLPRYHAGDFSLGYLHNCRHNWMNRSTRTSSHRRYARASSLGCMNNCRRNRMNRSTCTYSFHLLLKFCCLTSELTPLTGGEGRSEGPPPGAGLRLRFQHAKAAVRDLGTSVCLALRPEPSDVLDPRPSANRKNMPNSSIGSFSCWCSDRSRQHAVRACSSLNGCASESR
jgi:hypothetical protein